MALASLRNRSQHFWRCHERGPPAHIGPVAKLSVATVEVRWGEGMKRRILFVRHGVVAAETPVFERHRDFTVIRFGGDERFEIPDALVSGG